MKPFNFTFTAASKHIFNGLILFVLLLFFSNYFIDLGPQLRIVLVTLGVLTICLLVVSYKQSLLYFLSFVVPVSVPVAVFGDSRIGVPSELICALLSAFFFIKLMLGAKISPGILKHPITLLILLDLSWILLSSIFSQLPLVSFKRFTMRLCYYITFYYFMLELFNQDRKNIKKIFTLYAIGFLIPITYAMIIHARLNFTTVGSQRISAPFYYDHTIYGACLVFFIPFLIFYAFQSTARREKLLYTGLLVVFTAAAALSYSRAAWLSLLPALAIYVVLKYKVRWNYLIYGAGILLLLLIVNQARLSHFLKENKEISHSNDVGMHLKSISNVKTDASNRERINRWKCALRMFADKPFTGFGPGTYQFFYGSYQQREDMTRISTFDGSKGHAHSEYLNYLSETGLPGLLIFLSLIATVCVRCLRQIRKNQDQRALYILTGLLTYFIHAFFNGFLEFDKVAMPVFAFFAAITSIDLSARSHD